MNARTSADTAYSKTLARSYLRRRRRQYPVPAHLAQDFADTLAPLWRRYPAGSTLAAFLPLPTEPPLLPALGRAVAEGYRVVVPLIRPQRQLAWVEWHPQVEYTVNSLGVREPVGQFFGSEAFANAALRLVPALAFDLTGLRLGQGGGYYDRLLEELGPLTQDPSTVGVVFEREILDAVPAASWDARLAFVATEKALHSLGL